MANLQIPPTFAEPIIEDKATGQRLFNPIWLKWFIDLANSIQVITVSISTTFSSTTGTPPFGFGGEEGGDGGMGFALIQGTPGIQGAPGIQGQQGQLPFAQDGEEGERGFPGAAGPQGPSGFQGILFAEQGEPGDPAMMFLQALAYRTAATPVRALDTTYTNVSTQSLLVHLTLRCKVTVAGGTAFAQALMDTATPPTVAASGVVGLEAGLLNQDNTVQLVFLVNPGGTYKVATTAVNGTVTLGNWFEFPL